MSTAKPDKLDFYFDYISLFAYFAWRQLPALCDARGVELAVHPVPFGKLLDHWGQLGPAEIPPKRACVYKAGYRYARLHGFEFDPPKHHPFNPLPALRMSLPAVCGARQREVVGAIFEAGWSGGRDIGDPDELAAILDAAGLDGTKLRWRIDEPEIKGLLRRETEAAIASGVFGVPTMIVGGELFWGNDQMEHVELCLDGADPLDAARVAEMLSRSRAVDRKAVGDRDDGAGHA